MTRKQMDERVDDIAEFTELGDFLQMPLRTYSTGMRVRLALGVVTSIDPEILLLDEGIGAVDAAFLEKARERARATWSTAPVCWCSPRTPTSSCCELCDTRDLDGERPGQAARPLREVLTAYKGTTRSSVSTEALAGIGAEPVLSGTAASRP